MTTREMVLLVLEDATTDEQREAIRQIADLLAGTEGLHVVVDPNTGESRSIKTTAEPA